jgi:hypothetical protein
MIYTVDINIAVIDGVQFGRPWSWGSTSFPEIVMVPGDSLIVHATFDHAPAKTYHDLFYVWTGVYQYTNFGDTDLARFDYPYFAPYSPAGFSFEADFVIRPGIAQEQTAGIAVPISYAGFVTQAVPEPATWVLMLLGFNLMLIASRGRVMARQSRRSRVNPCVDRRPVQQIDIP